MDRGQRVLAKDYRGNELRRVVWEDVGRGVLICTENAYEAAVQTGEEPNFVGFPKEDVVPEQVEEPAKRKPVKNEDSGQARKMIHRKTG